MIDWTSIIIGIAVLMLFGGIIIGMAFLFYVLFDEWPKGK